ncbi:TcpQ domain-containing protein [Castellaniella sp.]|uniref:TcpQ domain-containing protein n=1 Tax=Castellaniella sp. TaxID=1955812 RepID=UPI00356685F5
MFKIWVAGCCIGGLVACTGPGHRAWWRELPAPSGPLAEYRFDWELSGDPELAPLQVFDDGRHTWLQYPVDTPVPAVFERHSGGDRLLYPEREAGYLRIQGVPAHLVIRGAQQWAHARRAGSAPPVAAQAAPESVAASAAASPFPASAAAASPILGVPAPAPTASSVALAAPALSMPVATRSDPIQPVATQPAATPPAATQPPAMQPAATQPTVARPVPPQAGPDAGFRVAPADGTLRKALAGWAHDAGWVFDAEHWAVDVDIPIAGTAVFPGAFKEAVRSVLAATELGDRPLQPCFYANQVLRVIPLAQRCDRTAAPGDDA